MKPRNVTEWAAIAELVGTAAVIVSLVFVGYSVRQNTAALQGATENLIFERHTALSMQFMLDPTLAEILVKMRGEDPHLSDVEALRWEKYQLNLLDIWALAFNRHENELLADSEWTAWDRYFIETFSRQAEAIGEQRWKELAYAYDADFWAHVGVALYAGGN